VNEKIRIVEEILNDGVSEDEIDGRQTLIFTNWVEAGVHVLENLLIKRETSFAIISGEVPATTRFSIVEQFNKEKIKVLIITLAGSEGLDLKGVRDVILLDPVWNPAKEEQIIGRAVRYLSHQHLPVSEREVNVYYLILSTPHDSPAPSGDEILYKFIRDKRKVLKDVIEVLKDVTI
jgi:SNF2 family DNA or RNA helicase